MAKELVEFVALQCGTAARAEKLELTVKDLDRKFGYLYHQMEEYNSDFEALEKLNECTGLFSTAELDELRPLLGLYGMGRRTSAYRQEKRPWGIRPSVSSTGQKFAYVPAILSEPLLQNWRYALFTGSF